MAKSSQPPEPFMAVELPDGSNPIEKGDVDPDWVPDHPEVIEWNEDIFGDSGRGCGGCGISDGGVDQQLQEMGVAGSDIPSGPPEPPEE